MVPPDSDRVPRVRPYSGARLSCTRTFCIRGYHPVSLFFPEDFAKFAQELSAESYNPSNKLLVWALPFSLAATEGIIVLFSFPLLT
jgi:hypothetical protein